MLTVTEVGAGVTSNPWKGNFSFSILMRVTDPQASDKREKGLESVGWAPVLTQCGLWFLF